jgi:hypothetical protein
MTTFSMFKGYTKLGTECHFADCCNAECRFFILLCQVSLLNVVMVTVIMMNVIRLWVVMLTAVMLSVTFLNFIPSIAAECCYTDWHYAKCHYVVRHYADYCNSEYHFHIIKPSVGAENAVMLNGIMLCVIVLIAVMLSVIFSYCYAKCHF